MNKIYDNGTMVLGNVKNLKDYICRNCEDLEDFKDLIYCVNEEDLKDYIILG